MHSSTHSYEFGHFFLDGEERLLLRDGQALTLTPKAFETLLLLVENSGHVLSKDEMLAKLWPDTFVEEANLTNNISILRRALGDNSESQQFIKTVPKVGYRFVASVKPVGGGANELGTRPFQPTATTPDATTLPAPTALRSRLRTRRRMFVIGVAAIFLVIAGLISLRVFFRQSADTVSESQLVSIRSIAVLPLTNLSGDPAQEYFADGMTEALITELAKVGQLRVISRTSMMQYKEARKTTPEIARELNVDAVVQGSVQRSNERVRISAQLIRGATDEHLWAETYERDLKDVLALQSEVARGIVSEIKIKLSPLEQSRLRTTRAINPAAHEAYLTGLYWLNQAIDEPRMEEYERLHKKSFEYFEQAIKFDPDYALAYAKLADSYHFLASSGFPQFYPKAKESALKAIALDDNVAEAHGALAYAMWRHEWDFAGAEKEFTRAEELAPNAYLWGYAQFLSTTGRHEEAIRKIKLAQDLDPLTLLLRIDVGFIYVNARQYDHAITQFRGVLELDPRQWLAQLGIGIAYVLKGMHNEGIAECQKALDLSRGNAQKMYLAYLAWAYAMAGRRNPAMKTLNDLTDQSTQESVGNVSIARIYGALGEKNLGMAQLERAYAQRQDGLMRLKVDPTFDGLRADPRFHNLLRRIGFP